MRFLSLLTVIITLSITSFSKPSNGKATLNGFDEKNDYEAAVSQSLPEARIEGLKKFILKYPKSEKVIRAQEMISGARAEVGDEKLRFGDIDGAIENFRLAVSESPKEITDRFFSGLLIKYPANLYFRGQQKAAFEIARMIEERINSKASFLTGLATFYLAAESPVDALRVANRAIELDANSAAAHHSRGFALRLNFDLAGATGAFKRAVELDPKSLPAKISWAEMMRATGKVADAENIYKQVLAIDPENPIARAGLVLTQFDTGGSIDAEAEMFILLEKDPKNFQVVAGAANWFAFHKEYKHAIDLALKAIEIEPRYSWSYIALARGRQGIGDSIGAENALLTASKYGKFPTIQYELALARYSAGLFREAVEALQDNFKIENNLITTKLGGRVSRTASNFSDLLAVERESSIFQVEIGKHPGEEKLKELFGLETALTENNPEAISVAVKRFSMGTDPMRAHRQIYAATRLLETNHSPLEALELARGAIDGVDQSLTVENPVAAILADELYSDRKSSFSRDQAVTIPNIPRQTLSKLIRGRIEEIRGWAYSANKEDEKAKEKLQLAISILPPSSQWARSSHWRLGVLNESQGNLEEALNQYILGFENENDQAEKRIQIESLYKRINGNLEGFEERLNKKTQENRAAVFLRKVEKPRENSQPSPNESTENSSASNRVQVTNEAETQEKIEESQIFSVRSDLPGDIKKETKSNINLEISGAASNEQSSEIRLSESKNKPKAVEKAVKTPEEQVVGVSNAKKAENNSTMAESPTQVVNAEAVEKENNLPKTAPPLNNAMAPARKEATVESIAKPNVKIVSQPAPVSPKANTITNTAAIVSRNETTETPQLAPCTINLSQPEVTLMSNGGSVNLIASVQVANGSPPKLSAYSSSPNDVQIAVNSGIATSAGKEVLVIRSVSKMLGLFTVSIEVPCGKKSIRVKVR